jgi:hypothetical protein
MITSLAGQSIKKADPPWRSRRFEGGRQLCRIVSIVLDEKLPKKLHFFLKIAQKFLNPNLLGTAKKRPG